MPTYTSSPLSENRTAVTGPTNGTFLSFIAEWSLVEAALPVAKATAQTLLLANLQGAVTIDFFPNQRFMGKVCAKNRPGKGHKCALCAAVFGKTSNLTRHVRTVHEKRKDHACPHCAAAFGSAGHLTTHVRTVHEKRKDHACPHCAAAFGRAGDLATHLRAVHEKRKDHTCPHCAAAFGKASNLTRHVRVVHEKRKDHACPH